MDFERIKELALEDGFVQAEIIEVEKLQFIPDFRSVCEENECGNYNANYGCPPACGTPEEMEARVRRYRYALVLQSQELVDDVMDMATLKPLKKDHTKRSLHAINRIIKETGEERGLAMMAGPCNLCDVCSMKTGEPCKHEELRFSCLSAYCLDVNKLAETCKMELNWIGNPVSFFSVYCFEPGTR